MDTVKEPHAVNLKVLRLSRPSLVTQHPLPDLITKSDNRVDPIQASLAYKTTNDTNPDPFLLTPILNLPPSFGSAYVGETFSCTLCANHDPADSSVPFTPTTPLSASGGPSPFSQTSAQTTQATRKKFTRDVRIEAEMKTPGSATVQKLRLGPGMDDGKGVDLEPGSTLQKIVSFDLKEEGNHVLAVTVSYYEATETSGRTRTFRKLYQFICKGSLIVRTKVGRLSGRSKKMEGDDAAKDLPGHQRWVLEAQLENCSEDVMQLEHVGLDLEQGLKYQDANWMVSKSAKPALHPGEVEQVCFVVEEDGREAMPDETEGKIIFGVLGIGWRTEMGNRGFLSTGKLGTRAIK